MSQGSKSQKSVGKSGAVKSGRAPKKQEEIPAFLQAEVMIIIAFAAALLLFLSNFHLCGVVGDFLRQLQLGLFGWIGFFFPILLFVGASFYLSNMGNLKAVVKLSAVIVAILALCGCLQMMFGIQLEDGENLLVFYQMSSLDGKGGGLVGGVLSYLLQSVVGITGTYLVYIVAFIVSGVCITERSLVKAVKNGSGAAYQHAKEDVVRRRAEREERQEERRRLREDNVVRGVNFGSTRIEEFPSPEEEDSLDGLTEKLSKKEKKKTTFEEAIPETAAAPPKEDTSPADVFSGKIEIPPEYEEPVPFEEDKPAPPLKRSQKKKSGPLYAERNVMTLEEMLAVPDIPLTEEAEPDYGFVQEEEVSSLVVSELSSGSAEIDDFYLEPEEDAYPDLEDDFYLDSGGDFAGLSEEEPESEQAPILLQESVSEPEPVLVSMPEEVREEPKRVVTASGKVIETETEQLQKRIEQKREEAAPEPPAKKPYVFPPVTLLKKGSRTEGTFSEQSYKDTAIKLQQTLRDFGVGVTVTNISCGPSVTRYELHPEQGVKVSKIVSLADDIKLSLAAEEIRIEAPIPGKSAVGIEVPNKETAMVYLRDLLESEGFLTSKSKLTFAVGKDIGGQPVMADIAKMPHLLIAGATGSGKSVCINTLIMSIIFKADPEEVKLIMVDPKVVELSVYNGIPHLLIPVVTDPKKASGALNWAVAEMEDRYRKFAAYNVRNLQGYNDKIKMIEGLPPEDRPKKMPQIVIIIDELADLMMVVPGEVEDAICRLAQLARAAGIHLVIATQRPSVNVITGLIKANVPSRIAFAVSSGVDSRTIIDMNGAEKLLGKGDMLFFPSGIPKPQRVQGAFISDSEVSGVVEFLTEQGLTAEYSSEVESRVMTAQTAFAAGGGDSRDEYFFQAGKFIIEKEKASIGMLQRVFKIGFNRAARIMDQLAEAGVVGEEEGTKPRKVLMTMEEFEQLS